MQSKNRVILCCPGERRSRYQASALFESGMLATWFRGVDKDKYKLIHRFLKTKHNYSKVNSNLIFDSFFSELLFKLTSRSSFLFLFRRLIHKFRNDRFNKRVAKRLKNCVLDYKYIYSYSSGCGETSGFLRYLDKKSSEVYIVEHCSSPKSYEHEILVREMKLWGVDSLKLDNESFLISDEEYEISVTDLHIVGSDFVRDRLIDLGVSYDKILKIKKPCLIEPQLNPLRKSYKSNDILKILIIGEVSLLKGSAHLLSIVDKFKGLCNFYFAGKVSLPSKLIPNASNVFLLGHVSRDKLTLLSREIHIGMHVSLTEDNPMAVIETLSLGIPCIVGPASSESIIEGHNGKVLDSISGYKIEQVLSKLISEPGLITEMSNNLRGKRDFYISETEYKKNFLNIFRDNIV